MSRREKVINALKRKEDYIPWSFDTGAISGFCAELIEKIYKCLGSRDPGEFFDYDIRTVTIKPAKCQIKEIKTPKHSSWEDKPA